MRCEATLVLPQSHGSDQSYECCLGAAQIAYCLGYEIPVACGQYSASRGVQACMVVTFCAMRDSENCNGMKFTRIKVSPSCSWTSIVPSFVHFVMTASCCRTKVYGTSQTLLQEVGSTETRPFNSIGTSGLNATGGARRCLGRGMLMQLVCTSEKVKCRRSTWLQLSQCRVVLRLHVKKVCKSQFPTIRHN
jgi:hypothetical protein